jgi:glutathione reductase (NADPH)
LKEFPKRIAIVGGGYIAVEFAGIFHNLGAEVAQIYRGGQILRGFDDDVREALATELRRKGINLLCNINVESIERDEDCIRLLLTDGSEMEVDQVMFATGRHPRTEGLGLEAAGVELTDKGAVKVDEYNRTSSSNIYAVGDVTDRMALTPVAIREGAAVAENLYNGGDMTLSYENIATAVFSQPSLGTVGLTEAQARQQFRKVDI